MMAGGDVAACASGCSDQNEEGHMSIKTILVALALEDGCKRVADRAVQLASEHGARLVGLHVMEAEAPARADLPAAVDADALARVLEQQAAAHLQALLGHAATPDQLHIKAGRAHDVIREQAQAYAADLVVIGPGAARNLREKVFGSTADRVVRCVECPVLVVRSAPAEPYRRVVVGVDFSGHAEAAVAWAGRVAPSAVRELFHSMEIPLQFEQAMLLAGTSQSEIERYRMARIEAAREKMVVAYGENGRLPKRTTARVVHGDPASTLCKASRRRAVGLVAVGTQGLNVVASHLLGSVARKVLSGAACDVLVVPATAADATGGAS